MKPAVFFSGATGFLGAEIARKLASRGHALHALARPDSDRSALAGLDVHWHAGDLRDAESLERAFESVCAASETPWIVHAGALISYQTRDRNRSREINVEGTRRMLEACRRHPVGRVLHVSSVVAVGPSLDGTILDERSAYHGDQLGCDYMTTKHEAELLALNAAPWLDLVVVNPGAIFGANGRTSNSQRVLHMIASGRTGPLPLLLAPPGSQSVVGLDDCAEGCVLALERGRRGERYLLVESIWTHRELIGLVARRCGKKAPIAVPRWIWAIAEICARALDGAVRSDFFTPQTLRLARVDFKTSGARARAELGWRPRAFERVIDEMLESLKLKPPS
ncbi:MAG TPA: NAD-dependent epimerase/dehydratase family protein [Planctomycetota bacterium]|nr:NAD-dependent epimerase/dehydratase family protein [Planctomycetota bacterium]